ncbi:MAG: MFS transporter [Candidatus Brocadiia bacterium]
MFGRLGNSFLNPHLVLSALVYDQTRSTALVGLLVALAMAGHRLPQLYVSSLVEHRERKKAFYIAASAVRILMLCIMAGVLFAAGGVGSWWPLAAFLTAYFVFSVAQGCASIPFFDMLAEAIGPTRVGSFFGMRHFLGSCAVLVCGFLVIQPVQDGLPSPTNYAVLTGIAIGVLGISWGSFALFREQENSSPPKRRSARQVLAAGRRLLARDRNYRDILILLVLARVNTLALTFYVPYGVERLGVAGVSGILLGFMSASRMASSLVWGRVSRRKGNRLCLVFAGLLFIFSPLAILAAPRLPGLFRWPLPFTEVELDLPLLIYFLALFSFGMALQAHMIGRTGFIVESAPEGRRPSYIGFLNTVTFPMTFLSVVAGLMVDWRGITLDTLVGIVAASGVLTLLFALRLREVRDGPKD